MTVSFDVERHRGEGGVAGWTLNVMFSSLSLWSGQLILCLSVKTSDTENKLFNSVTCKSSSTHSSHTWYTPSVVNECPWYTRVSIKQAWLNSSLWSPWQQSHVAIQGILGQCILHSFFYNIYEQLYLFLWLYLWPIISMNSLLYSTWVQRVIPGSSIYSSFFPFVILHICNNGNLHQFK